MVLYVATKIERQMARTVYLSERGDDRNDGLSAEKPVLSGRRAVQISLKEKATAFHMTGSDTYVRQMNSELEEKDNGRSTHKN